LNELPGCRSQLGFPPPFTRLCPSQPTRTFRNYRPFSAKQRYEGLVQRKLGARYFYSIGMHLALVLDRADPTWKARSTSPAR